MGKARPNSSSRRALPLCQNYANSSLPVRVRDSKTQLHLSLSELYCLTSCNVKLVIFPEVCCLYTLTTNLVVADKKADNK